jgi:hypothetical protein
MYSFGGGRGVCVKTFQLKVLRTFEKKSIEILSTKTRAVGEVKGIKTWIQI